MKRMLACILFFALWGCVPTPTATLTPTPITLATLLEGCTASGETFSAELPQAACD